MINTLNLELKDIPGQLEKALGGFSKHDANILSVVHHREDKTPRGTVPVEVKVDVGEVVIEKIIEDLRSRDVEIVKVGEENLSRSFMVILIGHVVHSDIRDTINKIDDTGLAEVKDLSLKMPGINKESTARLFIKADGESGVKKTINLIKDIAKEKELKVITEMDV
ncbi:amino acid-binding protein [archaeon SCG-AAA382B04]|nr:amino acid-binding protein [archaeon SCG-AAA382B04]